MEAPKTIPPPQFSTGIRREQRLFSRMLPVVLLSGVMGCAGPGLGNSLGIATSSSIHQDYKASYDEAWSASLKVVSNILTWNITAVDKESGFIYAEKPMNLLTWGSKIVVSIIKIDIEHTRVDVRSRVEGQFADWGQNQHNINGFFHELDQLLQTSVKLNEASAPVSQSNSSTRPTMLDASHGNGLVMAYSNIVIVGDQDISGQIKGALFLLDTKSSDALNMVKKHISRIEQSQRDWCDINKTPATLEISNETARRSVTWLAGVIARSGCYAKSRGKPSESDSCLDYQLKVLRQIGAPQEEINSVPNI